MQRRTDTPLPHSPNNEKSIRRETVECNTMDAFSIIVRDSDLWVILRGVTGHNPL